MAQRRFWRRKDTEKMGQIESQIFGISYVAKVILGMIRPVQPKSVDAAGVSQAPAPVLCRGGCFPGYPHRAPSLTGDHLQKTCFQPPPLLSVPGIEHRLPLLFQTLASCRRQIPGTRGRRPRSYPLSQKRSFASASGVLSGVACGVQ